VPLTQGVLEPEMDWILLVAILELLLILAWLTVRRLRAESRGDALGRAILDAQRNAHGAHPRTR